MEKSIKKAKIDKDTGGIIVTYDITRVAEHKEIMESNHVVVGKWKMHTDLEKAFEAMAVHLALLSEQIQDYPEAGDVDAWAVVKKFKVTGYSIGGDADAETNTEGITLIGQRSLKYGKVLNIVTPFQKWEDENAPYSYVDQLQECLEILENEINEYLGGKRTPNPVEQGQLFTEEESR